MTSTAENLIRQAYAAFNSRDIDKALSVMHQDVQWPKAWEGGYVTGHEAIRDYWTRQWKQVNPNVEPTSITERNNGSMEVAVHQTVKDLQGKEIFNGLVKHVYTIENGLIQRMDIEM